MNLARNLLFQCEKFSHVTFPPLEVSHQRSLGKKKHSKLIYRKTYKFGPSEGFPFPK